MSRAWLRRISFGGSLVIAAVLAGCGGNSGESPRPEVLTVVATDLAFQPREIHLSVDRRVTVRLQNDGLVLHDWTVETIAVTGTETRRSGDHEMGPGNRGAIGLHVAANVGRAAEITFTPEQFGEYVFYCTAAGHRQAGMEGRLVVG